ncbi:MAG: hypothetical protein U9P88_01230 [Patescibacteria group bacterium]|nr:hypothetical protein [Patescibacteria group bacterium]
MQVFEINFNNKSKGGAISDIFCYEPKKFKENNLGNFYMAGELINPLPENNNLLNNLSLKLKKEYYSNYQISSESALKNSLKEVNDYLEKEVRKENVSWMGNLNFAGISFEHSNLNFTKTGNLKILLIRKRQILNIGKNLEIADGNSYPSKTFKNIAIGKIEPNDKIIILTKDVFDLFLKENLMEKFTDINKKKELRIILKKNKKILSKISGICLMIIFGKKIKKTGLCQKIFTNASFSFLLNPIGIFLKKISPKIELSQELKKNIKLIALLFLTLIIGFFIFRLK